MIPKDVNPFSEKIMRKQEASAYFRFNGNRPDEASNALNRPEFRQRPVDERSFRHLYGASVEHGPGGPELMVKRDHRPRLISCIRSL
jgi:hypothetical protein